MFFLKHSQEQYLNTYKVCFVMQKVMRKKYNEYTQLLLIIVTDIMLRALGTLSHLIIKSLKRMQMRELRLSG